MTHVKHSLNAIYVHIVANTNRSVIIVVEKALWHATGIRYIHLDVSDER